ncbi:hypothetical protein [Mesorhizobium sp. M1307]|uniref:hypothetical protein n=1 Tax=Mesorhizobium sp. M1307 TaxID=2957079 RepID=UPI0033389B83
MDPQRDRDPAFVIAVADFEDSYFPAHSRSIKQRLIDARSRFHPDVVLIQARFDAHQGQREVNQLTWTSSVIIWCSNTRSRNWDCDLCHPNAYVPLTADVLERKMSPSTRTSDRCAPGTGSTARHSVGLRGCAGWNAGHRSISPGLSRSGRAKIL